MPAKTYASPPAMTIDPEKTYTATINTTLGTIVVELHPKIAPGHVNSFVFLAREGFYNDVIFHRVIPGFMIQGGDPTGTGTGGPGYQLKAEFNKTKHTRGVLSAARSNNPNSAGSQFFLMHADSPHLDGQYTAFGHIVSGIEVVDKIANLPTGANDRPKNPPKITSIEIQENWRQNAGPGTNGSQFFITHVVTDWLDGKHTVFGQVRDKASQDVVNAIKQGDTMNTVTIEEA